MRDLAARERCVLRGTVGALAALLGLVALAAPSESRATSETRLTVVTSSPTSWVARGYEGYTVAPELGWTFTPTRTFGNAIQFSIRGAALPGTDVSEWFLTFSAPYQAELEPGFYPDVERWPFQDLDRPGLEFGSSGRLDSRAGGFFEVFAATYGQAGEVLAFAADFTHYGETHPENFAVVQLRYNAVPEPSTGLLVGLGVVRLALGRRRALAARRWPGVFGREGGAHVRDDRAP